MLKKILHCIVQCTCHWYLMFSYLARCGSVALLWGRFNPCGTCKRIYQLCKPLKQKGKKIADRNCNYRNYKPCPRWPQRTRKGRIRPRSHASLATRSTRQGLACRSRRSCRQPGQGDINLDLSISHEITFKCFVHSFQLLRKKYI